MSLSSSEISSFSIDSWLTDQLTVSFSRRAQTRIRYQKQEAKIPLNRIIDIRKQLFAKLKVRQSHSLCTSDEAGSNVHTPHNQQTVQNIGSQIGDDRPISQVRFSPNSQLLATGSWSGMVKVWNVPACTLKSTHRGTCVSDTPYILQCTHTCFRKAIQTALVGLDGTQRLPYRNLHLLPTYAAGQEMVTFIYGHWTSEFSGLYTISFSLKTILSLTTSSELPATVLTGHKARVVRTVFHPSGNYVASASFDGTWRLWDVEKEKELLMQSGHSKEVYTVACQVDGSLIASGCVQSGCFFLPCEFYF